MNKERIIESVIRIDNIISKGWSLADNSNQILCNSCKSPLFYIKINWGVVVEEYDYGIMYNRSNRVYNLREVGFNLYCAKCGEFMENYAKYFYPEDKLVMFDFLFDEIDDDERAEIECCLNQWNQTGDFKSRYKSSIFNELKLKLKEYEKRYPIKCQKRK